MARRARVLVVDDEAPIRRTLQRVLKEHDVVLTGSGREAKALLEHDPRFDVVLCDLMMPEMTGMELHAWLVGAHPALAERVVFISGGAFTPALEGTERIRQMSRSLGAFARADESELEQVDVNAALDAAVRMTANELRFRARLERSFEPVPPVRAVSGKLTQLFLNLLVHAAQGIPEGHADEHRVTLRTWREDGFVCVELRDTARARSPEEGERLFEPRFSSGDGAPVSLGLAIARNLVTEFGGDVEVSAQRLVVRLPAAG